MVSFDTFEQARPEQDSLERARIGQLVRARLMRASPEPVRLGRYQLGPVLGRGAMGTVYEAWDAQLRRIVAVKTLRRAVNIEVSIDEARALASLSHPNVVTVFDIGVDDGRPWMAMELVHGQTLDAWARTQPWRRRLEAVLELGRGLVAVHRRGLVHRDVKPTNAMVSTDGRVRLMDFGLARPREMESPAERAETTDAATGPAGTPGYLAPELLRGARASEHSDQFAFSRTAGRVLADAPRPVREVLRRGLAVEPSKRWPRLSDQCEALRRAAGLGTRGRRFVIAVGILVVAVAGGAGLHASSPPEARPCTRSVSGSLWVASAAIQPAVRTRLRELHTEREAIAEQVCERERRGRWDAASLRGADACLLHADVRREALRDAFASNEPGLQAAASLRALRPTGLAACVDGAQRVDVSARPEASALREVEDQLVRIERDILLQRLDRADAAMARAWARATSLGWSPLQRDLRARRSTLRFKQKRMSEAVEDAESVYYEASRRADWSSAAAAAARLSVVWATSLSDTSRAQAWLEHADAAASRSEQPGALWRGTRAEARAAQALVMADAATAITELTLAVETYEGFLGRRAPITNLALVLLSRAYRVADDLAESERAATQALMNLEQTYGATEPLLVFALNQVAAVAVRRNAFERARGLLRRSLAISELHPSVRTDRTLANLGVVEAELGNVEEAERLLRRGVDTLREAGAGRSESLARALVNLGAFYIAQGSADAAERVLEEALLIRQSYFPSNHPEIGRTWLVLAELAQTRALHDEAAVLAQRAVETLASAYGSEHSVVAQARLLLAENLLQAGEAARARAHFAQAEATFGTDRVPASQRVRFDLLRARLQASGD